MRQYVVVMMMIKMEGMMDKMRRRGGVKIGSFMRCEQEIFLQQKMGGNKKYTNKHNAYGTVRCFVLPQIFIT